MSPRDRILLRRAKFVAAAMVSVAGCSSGETSTDSPPRDTGAEAQACLSQPYRDTGTSDTAADTEPSVCLTAPVDTGTEDSSEPIDTSVGTDSAIEDSASLDTGSSKDTGPMPCLTPPPDDP